jgi:hypothetical protein
MAALADKSSIVELYDIMTVLCIRMGPLFVVRYESTCPTPRTLRSDSHWLSPLLALLLSIQSDPDWNLVNLSRAILDSMTYRSRGGSGG